MGLAVAVNPLGQRHDAAHFAARRHVSDVAIASEIGRNVLGWHCWRQCRDEVGVELAEARGDADVQCDGGDDCDLGHGLGPLGCGEHLRSSDGQRMPQLPRAGY